MVEPWHDLHSQAMSNVPSRVLVTWMRPYGGSQTRGTPIAGWFRMEYRIKTDDLEVSKYQNLPKKL